MSKYLQIKETNMDGCGADASIIIKINTDIDFNKELVQKITNTIASIKTREYEWTIDSVVEETLKQVFGSDIPYEYLTLDYTIEI